MNASLSEEGGQMGLTSKDKRGSQACVPPLPEPGESNGRPLRSWRQDFWMGAVLRLVTTSYPSLEL
eukprot:CAMPEP_0115736298 /NCGR_PEP_ID=MMETSP0272-20121206/87180_1 /TAXON_ID=71861 /ORGANISM="Scrippsiella trochoidea, Strain CCMP3099" /LENGTH=65 /DNA_ID=CAMNT_0003180465 /DNA_START=40 /DNA_END=237 /DNA_ORIENTATION=+